MMQKPIYERIVAIPTWGWVLVGILIKVTYWYWDRNFYIDTSAQVLLGQRWLEGQTWELPIFEPNQQIKWAKAHAFMPLYGVLNALAGKVVGDYLLGNLLIDILGICFVFIACHTWLITYFPEQEQENKVVLFTLGFFLAPLKYLTGSGLLAFSGLLWGMAGLQLLSQAPQKRYFKGFTLALFGWSLALASRQAYLPFILLPLGISLGLLLSRKSAKELSLQASFIFVYCLGLGYLAWKWGQQTDPYFRSAATGFYPEHLLHLDPFGIKAFLYISLGLETSVAATHELARIGLRLFLHFLSVGVLWLSGKWIYQNRQAFPAFFKLSIGLLVLNFGMLCYLSLRIPPETWHPLGIWTYVMESRYYMPIMWVLLVILSHVLIQAFSSSFSKIASKLFMVCLVANILLIAGQLFRQETFFTFSPPPSLYHLIQDTKVAHPEIPIYIAPCSEWYLGLVAGAENLPKDWLDCNDKEGADPISWLVYDLADSEFDMQAFDLISVKEEKRIGTYRIVLIEGIACRGQ